MCRSSSVSVCLHQEPATSPSRSASRALRSWSPVGSSCTSLEYHAAAGELSGASSAMLQLEMVRGAGRREAAGHVEGGTSSSYYYEIASSK